MARDGNIFEYILFAVSLTWLFVLGHRQIIEAIEAFRNNFPRGGPRPPSHPLPANDGWLLRRKRRNPR
jgi:hypothetical protein